ncbi:MAG: cyclic nucleotide-binding domain-containing protein [Acidobacteriota bacterium]|nr:MAG: cyclic nucleotide-binding domain-containing protein [Acidobacteriota bacterium]
MSERSQPKAHSLAGNPVHYKELVKGMPAAVKRDLAGLLEKREAPAGAVVIGKGEPADEFVVLRSGKALLVIGTGEGSAVTREIARGEIVGIPEAVTGTVYDVSVVTRSQCRFESAKGTELARVLQLHPALCFRLVTLLGTNLCKGRQVFGSTSI